MVDAIADTVQKPSIERPPGLVDQLVPFQTQVTSIFWAQVGKRRLNPCTGRDENGSRRKQAALRTDKTPIDRVDAYSDYVPDSCHLGLV